MVDLGGLEPPTAWLQTARPNLSNLARTGSKPGESAGYGKPLLRGFALICTTFGAKGRVFPRLVSHFYHSSVGCERLARSGSVPQQAVFRALLRPNGPRTLQQLPGCGGVTIARPLGGCDLWEIRTPDPRFRKPWHHCSPCSESRILNRIRCLSFGSDRAVRARVCTLLCTLFSPSRFQGNYRSGIDKGHTSSVNRVNRGSR